MLSCVLAEGLPAVRRRQPRATGSPLADVTSVFSAGHAMPHSLLANKALQPAVSMQELQELDVQQIADELFEAVLQDALHDMTTSGWLLSCIYGGV